jgi:hypothetical protein
MILLRNHDYIISQLVDYRSDMSITLEQNYVNMMTLHKTIFFCSVDNAMSLELVLLEEPVPYL